MLLGEWCVAKKSQIQGQERERERIKRSEVSLAFVFTSMEGIAWGLPYTNEWLTHKCANLSEDGLKDESERRAKDVGGDS